MENSMQNNLEYDMESNGRKNVEYNTENMRNNTWERIGKLTVKQKLLMLLSYIICFTIISYLFLLSENFIAKNISKIPRKQALRLIIGMLVSLFVFLGLLLLKFLADRSVIRITRKTAMFFSISCVSSSLFATGWNFAVTSTAENRFLSLEIQFVINAIVGFSIAMLPAYPPDRNIIEITRRNLFFVVLVASSIIFMLNFCVEPRLNDGTDANIQ